MTATALTPTAQASVLGFRVGAYHWRLRAARKGAGLSQVQVAQLIGVNINRYQAIEALRERPSAEMRDEIADAVQADPVHLWPPVLDALPLVQRAVDVTMDTAQVRALQGASLLEAAETALLQSGPATRIREALATLSDRERQLLTLRYGLDGDEPCTLRECGERLNVHMERARQIEAEALHRLRRRRLDGQLQDDEAGVVQALPAPREPVVEPSPSVQRLAPPPTDGQRLRDARIARGWAQYQLAAVTGIAALEISRLEHDQVTDVAEAETLRATCYTALADSTLAPRKNLYDAELAWRPPPRLTWISDTAPVRPLGSFIPTTLQRDPAVPGRCETWTRCVSYDGPSILPAVPYGCDQCGHTMTVLDPIPPGVYEAPCATCGATVHLVVA